MPWGCLPAVTPARTEAGCTPAPPPRALPATAQSCFPLRSPVAAWKGGGGWGRVSTGWVPWANLTQRCHWLFLSQPWDRSRCWNLCPSHNGNWEENPLEIKQGQEGEKAVANEAAQAPWDGTLPHYFAVCTMCWWGTTRGSSESLGARWPRVGAKRQPQALGTPWAPSSLLQCKHCWPWGGEAPGCSWLRKQEASSSLFPFLGADYVLLSAHTHTPAATRFLLQLWALQQLHHTLNTKLPVLGREKTTTQPQLFPPGGRGMLRGWPQPCW